MFVLLASPGALASPAVAREVEIFKVTRRPFVLVSFGGGAAPENLPAFVRGVAATIDTAELVDARPSDAVVDRIVHSFRGRTQNQRLKRVFWSGLGATLAILALGLGWSARTVNESSRYAQATRQAAEAVADYPEDPRAALTHAAEALAAKETPTTRSALLSLLLRDPHLVTYLDLPEPSPLHDVAFAFGEGKASTLLGLQGKNLWVWDAAQPGAPRHYLASTTIASATANDSLIALSSQGPAAKEPSITLLGIDDLRARKQFPTSLNYVSSLRFLSPDRIAGLAPLQGIGTWELSTGAEVVLARWPRPEIVSEFAVAPSGRRIAFPSGHKISDPTEKNQPEHLALSVLSQQDDRTSWQLSSTPLSRAPALAFHDDDTLVLAYPDGSVRHRRAETGVESPPSTVPLPEHWQMLGSRGELLVADVHGTIVVQPLRGAPVRLPYSSRLPSAQSIAVSPSSRFVAGLAGDDYLGLWDLESKPLDIRRMQDWPEGVLAMFEMPGVTAAISEDGKTGNGSLTVRCGDRFMPRIDLKTGVPSFAALSRLPHGEDAAADCQHWQLAYVHLLSDVLELTTVNDSSVTTVKLQDRVQWGSRPALSPDGRYLYHCGHGFALLDIADPRAPKNAWTGGNVSCQVGSPAAFSPDGRYLAVVVGETDTIELWDLVRGVSLGRTAETQFDQITSLAWSLDQQTIAVGLAGSRLQFWSVQPENGWTMRRLTPPNSIALGDDMQVLGMQFTSDRQLLVWNTWAYSMPFGAAHWLDLAHRRLRVTPVPGQ